MILRKFDIEYIDRKEIKGKLIEDQLMEAPVDDHEPILTEFPNERILTIELPNYWNLYFDFSHT